MSDIEHSEHRHERLPEIRTFNDFADRIREEVKTSNWFSEDCKKSILETLDVEYQDFKNEILDRSTVYNGKSAQAQVAFFFGGKIGAVIGTLPKTERENVFQLVKQIISLGDSAK